MKNEILRVLHVIPTLKKDGAEVQLSEIFKNFKNVEIELFTFDLYERGDSIIENLNNIKIYNQSNLNLISLYRLIKNNDYDIVHSHLPKADLLVGVIRILNKKFIHICSVHAQYGTRDGENKIKYFFSYKLWKIVLNRSAGVIAISNRIKEWLILDRKIKSSKILTIHYGVKIKNRKVKKNVSRTIGMAARILPWKGWDKVLEVADFLNKNQVNFKLKLAGSDDEGYLKVINSLIKKYDLTEVVEVENHYENIEEFFEKIDIFLFLSNSEGFGLVALEAIENNVAVICSDISPLNEFVKNSEGALVNRSNTMEIAKFIEKLFNNENLLLKKVQEEQKQFIEENFTIENSANKIEKFYIDAINVYKEYSIK